MEFVVPSSMVVEVNVVGETGKGGSDENGVLERGTEDFLGRHRIGYGRSRSLPPS